MAIIKCKECGKEVSDKAKVCIHCGCPIKKIEENSNQTNDMVEEVIEKIEENKKKVIIGGIAILVLLLIFVGNSNKKPNITGSWENTSYSMGIYYYEKYTFNKNGTAIMQDYVSGFGKRELNCNYKFRNKATEIKISCDWGTEEAKKKYNVWVNFSMEGDTIYIDNTAYKRS